MKYLIALLFCFTLAAQTTVNNFTVKTNLGVGGTLNLSGANVNNAINGLVNPVSPSLADDWLATATWGDSLTAGTGGTPYPTYFQAISGTKTSNGGIGGETSTQIKVRMLAETNTHTQPTIIWAGRNNYAATSTVLADVAAMVSALASAGNTDKYLVLSVLNGSYGGYEAPGGLGYQQITNLNAQLSATYGSRYAEVREYLVSLYNPADPTDVADHAADRPPTSLRSDAIHLNSAGYSAVANFLFTNKFSQLRSAFGSSVTPALLTEYLKAPFTIGGTTPGVAYFSDVYSQLVRVGTSSVFKFFSLSGDATSIQANCKLIPLVDNTYDLGYSSGSFRWRDAYLSGSLISPAARITNASFVTSTSSTNIAAVGSITNLTSSTITTDRLSASSNYKEYRYNNNGGAGYAPGATYDLISFGSYTKLVSGTLLVRLWGTSSRAVYQYNFAGIGGGNTSAAITSASYQTYGGTALSGTMVLNANTPVAGDTSLRFTVGANALTAIDYIWTPTYVESGTSITFSGSP